MNHYQVKNQIYRKFKNFDEVLYQVKNGKTDAKFIERSSRDIERPDWHGTKDFHEAYDIAYFGWKKGLEELKEKVKKYRNSFIELLPKQDFSQEMNYGLEGEAVDIGRALEGIPESMIKFEPSEKSLIKVGNKMQRIILQGTVNCSILPEVIMNRGALITELIEAMELHGFRKELIYRNDVCRDRLKYRIEFPIKLFEESPDYSKISFILAHPSMLRRIVFSLQELENIQLRNTFGFMSGYGYGACIDSEKDDIGPNDMYFGQVATNYDLATLVKIIREKIAVHFNIILIEE